MKRYYLGVDWSNKVHELCVIEEALKRRDRGFPCERWFNPCWIYLFGFMPPHFPQQSRIKWPPIQLDLISDLCHFASYPARREWSFFCFRKAKIDRLVPPF